MGASIPVATLSTARLTLRAWRDDDLPAFRDLNLDREVRQYFPNVLTPWESDAFASSIRSFMAEQGWGFWAVERRAEGAFLGFVGLARPGFAPFTSNVEIGWRLARGVWGQGFATEAAEAAVSFAFTSLGLAELIAFTVPANRPSRRVMEKLGMTHDPAEDFLHPRVADGHPLKRHVLYRLSHEAWSAHRMTPLVNREPVAPERPR